MAEDLQQQIALAASGGAGVAEIEQAIIDSAPLDEDEKAALWLYAEALAERHRESMLAQRELAPLGS